MRGSPEADSTTAQTESAWYSAKGSPQALASSVGICALLTRMGYASGVRDAELARRRAAWQAPVPPARGWYKVYVDHVQQAHLGADLDFLVGGSGAPVPRDSH